MTGSTPRAAARLLALWAAVGGVQSVSAAPGDVASQQIEQIQQRQLELIQKDLENARRAIPPGGADLKAVTPPAPAVVTPGACHDIRQIDIRTSPHLRQVARDAITKDFAGKCLGVAEITQILALVTKDYIEQGYVTTRAYLPTQDLRTGVLLVDVQEGRLEKLRTDPDGKASGVPLSMTFPNAEGQVLNLRDLEQGIDQLNRLQSNNAKMAIEPGREPGGSVVVVRNEPTRPVHLFLTYDDQGSEGTGKRQGSATVSLDNLLGIGEMVSFTHRESLPLSQRDHYTRSQGIDVSVPHGYDTFSANYVRSQYTNVITLPSGTQQAAEGNNQIGSIGWNRVAYRDEAARLSFTATLTAKDAKNYFAGQFLGVSSRRLTTLDLKAAYSRVLQGGGLLQGGFTYTRGLGTFGALRDQDILPGDQPHAQFVKLGADASARLPFQALGRIWSFDSQLTIQKAQDTLYGSEKILIGSLYSVRGYWANSLSGDDGYYWRNGLSTVQPFQVAGETVSARFYGAVDRGWVRNFNPDLQGGQLTGAIAGVQFNWRAASVDVFRTSPISKPDSFPRDPAHTWLRLSVAI